MGHSEMDGSNLILGRALQAKKGPVSTTADNRS